MWTAPNVFSLQIHPVKSFVGLTWPGRSCHTPLTKPSTGAPVTLTLGTGIGQIEILVPGIFSRQLQALLQEERHGIGVSTGLCFQNKGTFKDLYG